MNYSIKMMTKYLEKHLNLSVCDFDVNETKEPTLIKKNCLYVFLVHEKNNKIFFFEHIFY